MCVCEVAGGCYWEGVGVSAGGGEGKRVGGEGYEVRGRGAIIYHYVLLPLFIIFYHCLP